MDPPETKLVAQWLRDTVWHFLDQDLLDSAVFIAERLYAMDVNNPDSRHLLGLVSYRMGNYLTAMRYTYTIRHLGCLYIYSKSCYKQKQYSLGVNAIERGRALYTGIPSPPPSPGRQELPSTSTVLVLLAHMYRAGGADKKAILNYGMALRLDPLCWEATSSLCQMGVNIKVPELYSHLASRICPEQERENTEIQIPSSATAPGTSFFSPSSSSPLADTFHGNPTNPLKNPFQKPSTPPVNVAPKVQIQDWAKPNATRPRGDARAFFNHLDPPTANYLARGFNAYKEQRARLAQVEGPKRHADPAPLRTPANYSTSGAVQEEVRRLSMQAQSSQSPSNPATTSPMINRQTFRSFGEPCGQDEKNSFLNNTLTLPSTKIALAFLTNLFSILTTAYMQFCQFHCNESLATLKMLPPEQANTPWVLAKKARLYFEKVEYAQSLNYFMALRVVDRFRQEDMEYYSTLLWHLQNHVDLTFLSTDLIAMDRNSPQAWCAVGNALSLNKDSENALKCFQRAVHLDPSLAYAHTLQGHEKVASDSYEHAKDSYRLALLANKRHYNAWYGLGMVFMRLGNNKMAELHFRKAASINPCNVVLQCCIGMVLEKLGCHQESLKQYTMAAEYQPLSALSLYKRARLLVKMERYPEALVDLHLLVTLAPDEASVHFLLGQIHKLTNNRRAAVREFTIALNLDPKGSHLIKEALEGLQVKYSKTMSVVV